MKALFICPTYGRIPFLGRMLAGFLRQTYDDKHLVIINDDKNVELCCDYDDVTCININKKILLDAKRNIGACFGNYDLIFPQDDDDIAMPNRIANHVKKFQDNPNINLYRNSASYLIYGDEFKIGKNAPNACSYSKQAYYETGGYQHFDKNSGGDAKFFSKMIKKMHEYDESDIDYVYNWGGISNHLSCSNEINLEKIAYDQLVGLDLIGKKYWIYPDFFEYDKFLTLAEMYKGEPIKIKHVGLGKINIPNG
jgi:glycosyltransferase involved in cell wall biosynthesis